MRSLKVLAAVVVVVAVLVAAWTVLGSSSMRVVTQDVTYEAEFGMVYTDGTSDTIKRYKTASVTYGDKLVDCVTFDLSAKFKATRAEDVRLMSPRAGSEHETAATFYVVDPVFGAERVFSYPLSMYTNTDYSVLDTGDWYDVFSGLKITTAEMGHALGEMGQTTFSVRVVVDVWYNLDPKQDELVHHELTFEVEFNIVADDSAGDVGGGTGGGAGGGSSSGGGGADSTLAADPVRNPLRPEPPKEPQVKVDDPVEVKYVPWSPKGSPANKNLNKR